MNTPAHVVLNLFVLGEHGNRKKSLAVVAGALLPDLPMWAFYAWVKFVERLPEEQIWSTEYFKPGWQSFIDLFNSFPIIALGALLAYRLRKRALTAFFLSMGLHGIFDLLLHAGDGHAHFWPLSSWSFTSPVSYWDPAHYGIYAASVEALMVIGLSLWMARSSDSKQTRIALALLATTYVVGIAFAVAMWMT